MIKQAIILCGGTGSRLRPVTDKMSKQMIPVLGYPLTEWNILQFKKHGITDLLINLYTMPEVMRRYLGDGSKWGVNIIYNLESEPPGVAGSIKQFEAHAHDEFFVIYGDMISFIDYTRMEKEWRQKDSNSLGIQRVQLCNDYATADVAELDDEKRFIVIHPKPHTKVYINPYRMRGAFIMKKEILQFVPTNCYYEIGRDLLPDIIAGGHNFYGYECDDYSQGIDTIDQWKRVEEYLTTNQISFASHSSI